MENQGKRLVLAVGLALGVMLVWNLVFPPAKDPPKPAAVGSGQLSPTGSGAAGSPAGSPQAPGVVEPPCTDGAPTTLEFPGQFSATFSTCGGALVSWKLADGKYENDATRGELLPNKPGTGAFYVGFWGSTLGIARETKWTKTHETPRTVSYKLDTPHIDLEKTYTVVPEAYLVKMTVKYTVNPAAGTVARQRLAVSAFAYQDPKVSTEGGMQVSARVWSSTTMRDGEIVESSFKAVREESRHETNIQWTGFGHPYLLAAFSPRHEPAETIEKFTRPYEAPGLEPGFVRTIIVFPETVFEADKGRADTREVVGYFGPKNYQNLKITDEQAGFATGFAETIDLGWFAFIGRPLLWLLQQFYSAFGNWGIAIILLTFLVKAATLYWTTKSMRSMKAMAALAPQMKQLQEKYKDDKQRLQAETMALYKQHNVNPIAGCLPILLQMPIWIALYRMLSSAGELYHAPFVPGWIDDLTTTDPAYVLPFVLVITMFIQARLTPVTGDSRQQKFLQYGMPLMFGVMSFFFPAGLTLYIFTNTVLSAFHSIYMNKYDKKSLDLVAKMKANAEAAKTAAAGSGKSAKPSDKSARSNQPATSVASAVAKPAIDVEAAEEADGETDDDGADGAPAPPGRSTSPARQRPRGKGSKKRRR